MFSSRRGPEHGLDFGLTYVECLRGWDGHRRDLFLKEFDASGAAMSGVLVSHRDFRSEVASLVLLLTFARRRYHLPSTII